MSALHAVLRGSGGVGVCCNAVLTRLMINRHRNPRCFGRGNKLSPLFYMAQASAWCDANVFKTWLIEVRVAASHSGTRLCIIHSQRASHAQRRAL